MKEKRRDSCFFPEKVPARGEKIFEMKDEHERENESIGEKTRVCNLRIKKMKKWY